VRRVSELDVVRACPNIDPMRVRGSDICRDSREGCPHGPLAGKTPIPRACNQSQSATHTTTVMTHQTLAPSDSALHVHRSVDINVSPALTGRKRLTCFFRPILAIPHLLLVGAPMGFIGFIGLSPHAWHGGDWTAGMGALAALAGVCALIMWFAIVFTGRAPDGLWALGAFYLRWRVRAAAYAALLRDEYPPFGDAQYPAELRLDKPPRNRDRLTVAFRLPLLIPHIVVLWVLGMCWAFTTIVAWLMILLTGRYPGSLFEFGVGVMRWSTRVEAYALLLTDEYPPFNID
jgi:hypothetical protein